MPIITKAGLPVNSILREEGVKLQETNEKKEAIQIAILNLMPLKEDTELQLLRKLSNTEKDVQVTFVKVDNHKSKNVSQEHLENFYEEFSTVKKRKWDGFIITGAPIELLDFEEVKYWKQLEEIMEWTKTNVKSTLHICWGGQAGLYHHYKIQKRLLPDKKFGVFKHFIENEKSPLVHGLEQNFMAPHSRHTTVNMEDIKNIDDLTVTAFSKEAGVFLVENKEKTQIFDMGHLEYDLYTLDREYRRDKEKGLDIEEPENYYENEEPKNTWRQNGDTFYSNWINYYLGK